jgi:TorA maturation chaperone TorD
MTATVTLHHALAPEDQARAEIYAVLARLFSAAPDAPVLAALGASDTWPEAEDTPVAGAWNRLVAASRAMDAEAAEQEYTDLFIGVGKAEVNPHASYWMPQAMPRPLVAIRAELAQLGLDRHDGSALYEDHIGALLETMRFLIAGADERRPSDLAAQKGFFDRWISPAAFPCCDAIIACTVANYYRRVAELTALFLTIERDSLAMD